MRTWINWCAAVSLAMLVVMLAAWVIMDRPSWAMKGFYGGTTTESELGSFTDASIDDTVILTTSISAPAAPSAGAKVYLTTSGGKLTLCALFPTGAAQCFATQP